MENENANDDLVVKELDDGTLQVGEDVKPEVAEDDDVDERITRTEGDEDEVGHADESEDDAEARRQRNRERRAQNKASRKEYVESLKRELAARDEMLNELSTRLASVEQHSVGNQAAQLDAAITEAQNYYNHFKEINRKAIELADGATAVDAQEKMFAAQNRYNMLQNAKKNMGVKAQQQPKPLDPRMAQHANAWIERNSWYDPSGSDADSDLVMKIDNRLVQEGWNPTTREYWEELDSRVKKYLPHRAISGYNRTQGNPSSKPRVPVAGSGQESGSAPKGTYRLSAERVKALKDAGVYDDPKKRADAIRRFQLFDKENTK